MSNVAADSDALEHRLPTDGNNKLSPNREGDCAGDGTMTPLRSIVIATEAEADAATIQSAGDAGSDAVADFQQLRLFWTNFIRCHDDKDKVLWLDLFIAKFSQPIRATASASTDLPRDLSSDRYRFLAPAASQLTCYLLQLVHEIVGASIGDGGAAHSAGDSPLSTVDNKSTSTPSHNSPSRSNGTQRTGNSNGSGSGNSRRSNRQQQLHHNTTRHQQQQQQSADLGAVAASFGGMLNSDITTIVALREFLVHGVGGRILETLLVIDTKNMLCARELTGLLINLFPTSTWATSAAPTNIKAISSEWEPHQVLIGRLEIALRQQRPRRKWRKSNCSHSAAEKCRLDMSDDCDDQELSAASAGAAIDVADYRVPEFAQLSGEYIGSVVLNLILKLVREDVQTTATRNVVEAASATANSVTMLCLRFTISAYASMADSEAFQPQAKEILSLRLLTIICRVLPNQSPEEQCSVVDQVLISAERLLATESVTETTKIANDHLISISLVFALILQRCALRHTLADSQSSVDAPTDALHAQLADILTIRSTTIDRLLLRIEPLPGGGFLKCLNIVQRLIRTLRSQQTRTAESTASTSIAAQKQRRSRLLAATGRKGSHMSSSLTGTATGTAAAGATGPHLRYRYPHHLQPSLACTLESLLLRLAKRAQRATHLRHIYRHLQLTAATSCCCNVPGTEELSCLLATARQAGALPFYLQYLRNNCLRPMFGVPASRSAPCEQCERRRYALATAGIFAAQYAHLAASAVSSELPLVLRHLARVAKYLPFECACRVLAEVLLPQFRQHKEQLAEGIDGCAEIVSLCLNAFLCYLRDIRLIKGFYNDDNLQHLGDLLAQPRHASLVCCLLRIGVDNSSFVGENCGEQQALAERMRRLQTDALADVTTALSAMFRACGADWTVTGGGCQTEKSCAISLVAMEAAEAVGDSAGAQHSLLARMDAGQLCVTELLQLAVIYWNQALQQLRRSLATGSLDPVIGRLGEQGLAALVQNSLTCFLYSPPIFVDVNSDEDGDDAADNDDDRVDPSTRSARFVWVPQDTDADPVAAGHEPKAIYATTGADISKKPQQLHPLERHSSHYLLGCASNRGSSELIYDLRLTRSGQMALNAKDASSVLYSSYDESHVSSVDLSRLEEPGSAVDVSSESGRRREPPAFADEGAGDVAVSSAILNASTGVVHNVFQYFSDNVWDLLFPAANAEQTQAAELAADRQQLERCFGVAADRGRILEAPENKRYFLQLFEIACGVLMCDQLSEAAGVGDHCTTTPESPARRMSAPAAAAAAAAAAAPLPAGAARSRALHQLKAILLRHSEHIHDSAENGAAVVVALQSLLKCAEQRYRCCMVDDCEHASYAQAPAAGADALLSVTTTTVRDVGDNLCCAAATNSFDGGGGGGGDGDGDGGSGAEVECGAAEAMERVGGNTSRAAVTGRATFGAISGLAVTAADSYSSDAELTDGEEDHDDHDDHDDELNASESSPRHSAIGGGGGGERVSSDGSYLTADEGYDGDAELAASLDSDADADTQGGCYANFVNIGLTPDHPDTDHCVQDNDDVLANSTIFSQAPVSRYRQHIVHADICRIVIDILIELSKRCLDDPDFWPKYLLPLTQRFIAIRESIGGSIYLVRGFAPVLESGDLRLRELQKAVLGLVTDICSADTLSAYLTVMANGERPPMEVLAHRLFYLGAASHRLQPVAELRFPSRAAAGNVLRHLANAQRATSPASQMLIDLHRHHCAHKLSTVLTRAAYLMPTDSIDLRPWSTVGFSVSTWINLQLTGRVSGAVSQSSGIGGGGGSEPSGSATFQKKSPRSLTGAIESGAGEDKVHLLTVGSDRLMLSIYLHSHDPTTMFFQLTRPDSPVAAASSDAARSTMPRSHTVDAGRISDEASAADAQRNSWQRSLPRRSTANRNASSSGHHEPIGLNLLSSTTQALQTTRIALRNSLNQFNLFVSSATSSTSAGASAGASNANGDRDFKSLRYPLEVKGVRLVRNKWTHLAFSVMSTDKGLSIRITIDGLDWHDVHLPCVFPTTLTGKPDRFTLLCVGDTHNRSSLESPNSPDATDHSPSASDAADHIFSLANVQLFRRCITSTQLLATLVAYGPDATTFERCATDNTVPNFGNLNAPRAAEHAQMPPTDVRALQQILRDNLALHFSASDPLSAIGYHPVARAPPVGHRVAVFGNTRISALHPGSHPICSLQTAIVRCGGFAALCYLFARVVELCPDGEQLQATTLQFVLRTVHTNSTLYSEFCRLDGMHLLSPVIRSQRCRRGVPLLAAILDVACDQAVLLARRTGPATGSPAADGSAKQSAPHLQQPRVHVNQTTAACVVHPGLIVTIIRRYSDWHSADRPNGCVIETLLGVLQALVREKHPRQSANMRRLRDAGLVSALLNFCKFYLVGVPTPVPLSLVAAQSLVALIGTFAGAPPAPTLLDDLVKVLLLLHQPSDSFITHDRSKFYFLATPAIQVRPRNRLSLPHLATGRRVADAAGVGGLIAGLKGTRKSASPARRSVETTAPIATPANVTAAGDLVYRSPTTASTNPTSHSVDLSAIADCSRVSGSRWPLHESDFVAAQRKYRPASQSHAGHSVGRRLLVRRPTASARSRHTSQRRTSRRRSTTMTASGGTSGSTASTESESNEVSESGFDESMSGLVNQYDIIAAADIAACADDQVDGAERSQQRCASIPTSAELGSGRRSSNISSSATTTSSANCQPLQPPATSGSGGSHTAAGVRAIQVGLFTLIKDCILILPDTTIHDVLAHYVTVDIVLVLANHRDAAVRAAIVRLLATMCQRLSATALGQLLRSHSWLHCGNQIALHPVDVTLVAACSQWVTGAGCLSIEQMLVQPQLRIVDVRGLHALLAVLPQAAVGVDLQLLRSLLQLVERLYAGASAEHRQYMVEHGLVAVVARCVQQFCQRRWAVAASAAAAAGAPAGNGGDAVEPVANGLLRLGQTIGAMAMHGCGAISVLWELLNALTFFEETRVLGVLRGLRSYQADVLHALLAAFLPAQRSDKGAMAAVKFSISEISLTANTTNLSGAEIRTRFELLIDRIVQFLSTAEPSYQPTDAEHRLAQAVIQLAVCGLHRAANLIIWSLCPARPLPLKLFTAHTLHRHSQQSPSTTAHLSQFTDLKLLRCMLGALLATDYEIIPASEQEVLRQLAAAIGLPKPNVVTHLSQTLEKLEAQRQSAMRDRRPGLERAIHRHEPLVAGCIEAAMKCTRAVVELQNAERRQLINAMRASDDETRLAEDWRCLVQRMTHEGAPWHAARVYPGSWKLDETEGPARSRSRLRRCHQSVAERFLMSDGLDASNSSSSSGGSGSSKSTAPAAVTPPAPLQYLRESLVQRPHFPLNDQVLYTFACCHLPVDVEHDGEMIVTESQLIFVPNDVQRRPVRLPILEILEIWPRRHQHRDTGLEFCLASQRSVLFVFAVAAEREQLVRLFADKVVQGSDESKLMALTHDWSEGGLTNWEYLMELNQISGRTFQDLMQYPVFPWILADYTSAVLDLNDPASFRRLDRPIAVQSPSSEAHYINNYSYLEQAQQEMSRACAGQNPSASASGSDPPAPQFAARHMQPYHYGSHYSNSGTVLHYLVRVPPFTNYFLRYQDNSFDLPDRTFHSMHTTWRLASRDSPTDVKELIPEFFTLPEMLENFESFRFGLRQSGERVDNVALPPWSAHSARQFVLAHRQALESDAVRAQLHRWIDLVFGWRQTGAAAVSAINVFHPATYIGFSAANVTDPVEKQALETMVRTYGQMPRQLFAQPHTAAIVPVLAPDPAQLQPACGVSSRIRGLKWGRFAGSPQLGAVSIGKQFTTTATDGVGHLVALPQTNVCYALPAGGALMQGAEPDTMCVISWRQPDGIVRVRPLTDATGSSSSSAETLSAGAALCATSAADPITACGADAAATQLWFGHRSGRLVVHRCGPSFGGGGHGAQQLRLNRTRYAQHSAPFGLASYNSTAQFWASAKVGGVDGGTASSAALLNGVGGSGIDPSASASFASDWREPIVLVRHTAEVTAIAVSCAFRICVSVGADGAACIWDANTLAYVRSIEPPSICRPGTPIRLVAISATLGDIVTVHSLAAAATADADAAEEEEEAEANNGAWMAGGPHATATAPATPDVGQEATEEEGLRSATSAEQLLQLENDSGADESTDFVSVQPLNVAGGRSVMRVHTINARYVGHLVDAERIECVAYSAVREGTGINVIAAGYADGVVRLWSSWDLSLVRVLRYAEDVADLAAQPPVAVRSLAFATYQHLAVLGEDGVIRVWQADGLAGKSPKFPRVGGDEQVKRRSV